MNIEEKSIQEQQIQDAADALREDIRRIENDKKHSFYKGLTCGAAMALALCLLVFFVIPSVQVWRAEQQLQELQQEQAVEQERSVLGISVRQKIERLTDMINLYYYEDVDKEKLEEGLYKGLLEGIGDKYSAYYTAEEYESLMVNTTSILSGIGTVLQQNPDTMQVKINHVYEGSPAEKAGLLDGDIIVRVDDIECTSMELTELVTHIRGEKGTTVHLKIYRSGERDYIEKDIERDIVDMPTLTGRMLEDGIGYIMIAEFGSKTGEEFAKQVEELEAQGMTSLLIDLRDNPGGIIDSATAILDQILPEGVIVSTQAKFGKKREIKSDASCMKYPLVVLINEGSASSSEIFAGAIRDFEYGTLIGTKTFGKGIVQTIRQLSDGSAIKLTTSRYFTPNGDNIHGEGIEPDIELEYKYLDPDATVYDMKDDNQIQKAIEVLKEKK